MCPVLLPGDEEPLRKYVVLLHDHDRYPQDRIAVAIASTDRRNGRALAAWEVLVGTTQGFPHDTIIDGRWIFTLSKSDVLAGD